MNLVSMTKEYPHLSQTSFQQPHKLKIQILIFFNYQFVWNLTTTLSKNSVDNAQSNSTKLSRKYNVYQTRLLLPYNSKAQSLMDNMSHQPPSQITYKASTINQTTLSHAPSSSTIAIYPVTPDLMNR